MRGDQAFENQFQWEVDRWVFRRRQRGEPVEITIEERDRLIALHRSRMARGSRLFGGVLLGSLVLSWPNHLSVVPIVYLGAVLVGMPLLSRWAYDGVADELHGRPLLGMPLHAGGRMARRVQAASFRRLGGALFWAVAITVLFGMAFGSKSFAGPRWMTVASYCILGGTIALLAWMLALKWAQHERERLHQRSVDDLRRAREMHAPERRHSAR